MDRDNDNMAGIAPGSSVHVGLQVQDNVEGQSSRPEQISGSGQVTSKCTDGEHQSANAQGTELDSMQTEPLQVDRACVRAGDAQELDRIVQLLKGLDVKIDTIDKTTKETRR